MYLVAIVGRRRASLGGWDGPSGWPGPWGQQALLWLAVWLWELMLQPIKRAYETGKTAGVLGTGLDVVYPEAIGRLYGGYTFIRSSYYSVSVGDEAPAG